MSGLAVDMAQIKKDLYNAKHGDGNGEIPGIQAADGGQLMTIALPVTATNGLTLAKNHDGYWIVVAMSPSMDVFKYGIHLGMEILSINNIDTFTLPDNPIETGVPQIQSPNNVVALLVKTRPHPPSQPGQLVTAVLQKQLKETKLGIALHQDLIGKEEKPIDEGGLQLTGKVYISEIVPKSFGANSGLKTGMTVISINNTLAIEKKEAADQLRNSTGILTVLAQEQGGPPAPEAHYVTATVQSAFMREMRENPGIAFVQATQSDGTSISIIDDIDPKGPFFKSPLRTGMQVVSINNFSCETPSIAHCLLTRASQEKMVTILAKQSCQTPAGTIVTATVIKSLPSSKLGIMFGMNQDRVVVRYVREGGLLDGTKLEPGMIVHRVNNIFIRKGMHNKQVSQLLSKLHGPITFLAEAPSATGDSSTPPDLLEAIQTATLWTSSVPDQPFGLKLARSASNKRRIVISHLQEGGLAAASGLKIGMFLLAINDTPVMSATPQTPEEIAMNLIQQVRLGAPVVLLVQEPPHAVPPVITGTLIKATPETKVGLRMRTYKDRVAIIGIVKGSAAATLASDLLAGMLIQSVNNIDCSEQTPEFVANLLAELDQELITILALTPDCTLDVSDYVTAAISTDKPLDADTLFDYKDGKVYVSHSGVVGPFCGTALRRGMEILRINNMECALLTPVGIQALFSETCSDNSDQFVTLLAACPPLPPRLLTEVLCKETADTTIGITFRSVNSTSKVIITHTGDGSLASTTNLTPGMELVLVNNCACHGMSVENVGKLLHDAQGTVTLVVGDPRLSGGLTSRRNLVTATLERPPFGNQPLGIRVKRDADGKIVVTAIAEGSLAAKESNLEKGMELLSINNIDCQLLKAMDVMALLSTITGTVTLLAERPAMFKGELVTAAVLKATLTGKVGITVSQNTESRRVLVKAIVPDSPCANTDLKVGMWIKTVNNKDVSKASALTVARKLGAETPTVVVLAETTNEPFVEESEPATNGKEEVDGGNDEKTEAATTEQKEQAPTEEGKDKEHAAVKAADSTEDNMNQMETLRLD